VQELLYRRSGLLGLSGTSGDLRELEPAAAKGDARAALALDVHAYRGRKYIGAYAAALGGIDALTFSGAVAEHWPSVRARVLAGLEFLGLRLDESRNRAAGPDKPARLSPHDAAPIWLIPTDEEREIAREVGEVLGAAR
jgi:acetate kinase